MDEKDDDDDTMNDKELEEDKQEANHEDEVHIYDKDTILVIGVCPGDLGQ
jgi:hypothetical protein